MNFLCIQSTTDAPREWGYTVALIGRAVDAAVRAFGVLADATCYWLAMLSAAWAEFETLPGLETVAAWRVAFAAGAALGGACGAILAFSASIAACIA